MEPPPAPRWHAERTSTPERIRWMFTGDALPGPILGPDGIAPLDALIDHGTLVSVWADQTGVWTELRDAATWTQSGPTISDALTKAVAQGPNSWQWRAHSAADDETCFVAAQQICANVVAPIAAGHGGEIRIVGTQGGVIDVFTCGACRGCSAVSTTLHDVLLNALRREIPGVLAVREVSSREPALGEPHAGPGPTKRGGPIWNRLQIRRRSSS